MSTQNPLTPSTMHPVLRMTYKRVMRIERIARLSLDPSCYSNVQIANILNVNPQTVVLIRQLPEYHAKIMELSTGVLSSYDDQLRANIDNARQEMKDMIPSAVNVIRNAVLGRFGANLQFKAAQEIFDRDGNLAKVSKSSVTLDVIPNMAVDPEVATNLMALLVGAPAANEQVESNTNTGFTKSSLDAGAQQKEMRASDPDAFLESVDLSKKRPN